MQISGNIFPEFASRYRSAMYFIGSQHAWTEVRSTCMISVDHVHQYLAYVVLPDIHMFQELLFQYAVYPFGDSVVPRIVSFRHADSDVASAKHLHIRLGTILKALVRVMYRTLASSALLQSHLQRLYGVLMPHVVRDLPSDYLLGVGVCYQE